MCFNWRKVCDVLIKVEDAFTDNIGLPLMANVTILIAAIETIFSNSSQSLTMTKYRRFSLL